MLRQQRERLLRQSSIGQHAPRQQLHAQIVARAGRQLLRLGDGLVRALGALQVGRQRRGGLEVGDARFTGRLGDDIVVLAEGEAGAELQHADGQRVGGGEGGRVEVDDLLVLALVEGVVDVDELWFAT